MSAPTSLTVACLCARWCGTCRDYAATFDAIAASHGPDLRWWKIDIEDEAALVDDVDVEDFPTLLIARGAQVLFFGSVTPHPQTLARLVESALADALPEPRVAPEVEALAARLVHRGDHGVQQERA